MNKQDEIVILKPEIRNGSEIPLASTGISAGFPSPADDYIEGKLDLNELLITHPSATFYIKVIGDSMINAGINSGDILIVDRSIEPVNNKIVVAVYDGEFTVKRFIINQGEILLKPENPVYKTVKITESMDFEVWGVVTSVIHRV